MNWTGKITEYFVKNGKLTLLLMVSLFVWGVVSYFQTTKKYNPTIVAPAFQVVVDYPGATREEVLEQVTKPLENVITDIAGVEDIYSVSVRGGRSIVNVNFFVGEDLNAAKIALNDRIQSDMNLAPKGIPGPSIKTIDPEDVPVTTLALTSKEVDPISLRKFAFKLRDRLSIIPGTSRIFVYGGRRRELSIIVDQKRLANYGIALHHIESALKQNNLYLPSGMIKSDDNYYPLEAMGWVHNADEVKEIVVVTNDSVDIRLKDVATVKESMEEVEEYVRHTKKGGDVGSNAVLLSISKLKGVNISDVTESIERELKVLQKGFIPSNIKSEVIVNSGDTARDEIGGLLTNLITSIAIVIAILFFFLNMKAAILVAVAIPLTLASVFGFANLFGQSINRITLFALILSLGMLVDNATVVIENIVRKVGATKDLKQSTFIEAVNEVGLGLFMSTVTTVVAFIPMAYIGGMMGPYMGPIPFFVPTALILALIISYSINPWMASVLIKRADAQEDKKVSTMKNLGMRFIFSYKHFLRNILSNPAKSKLVLIGTVIGIVVSASLPAFYLVKFRMLPKADVDQFFVYVDLPAGSPLDETYRVTQEIERELLNYPQVTMVQSYVGRSPIIDFNGLFKGVSSRNLFNQATLRVGLLPDEDRKLKSEELVISWRKKLYQLVNTIAAKDSVKLKIIEDPPGPPVLSTLLVRIQGWNIETIKKEAKAIFPFVKSVDGVVDTDISLPEETETYHVVIDHYETSKAKISPAQIVTTLNSLYSGKILGIYHNKDNIEQELIRLRFPKKMRMDPKDLEGITVRNPMRISIPLSRLVKIEKVKTQPPLMRENHVSTVYLTGEMGERSVTYAGIDILKHLYNYALSDGKGTLESWNLFGMNYKTSKGEEIKISLGGEWELTLEVFRDLMIAMAVAVMVIYFVLVAQFRSFMDPLIIMSTIPLSVLGVFPGFMLLGFINGEYFTATSMIGIIALAGIAVNNSIILLEYLNSLKSKEMDLVDALVEACATRLRPIALTTITTMLGSMTILDDPVWSGLAWAIILGLGMSSSLILIVFPALYAIAGKKSWPSFHKKA